MPRQEELGFLEVHTSALQLVRLRLTEMWQENKLLEMTLLGRHHLPWRRGLGLGRKAPAQHLTALIDVLQPAPLRLINEEKVRNDCEHFTYNSKPPMPLNGTAKIRTR